jgi:hypothetical protein
MRRSRNSIFAPVRLVEAAFRQSKHIVYSKLQWFLQRNTAPIQLVFFWPEKSHPYTVVYRVLHSLGVSIKKGLPPSFNVPISYWEDSTFSQLQVASHLINAKCVDISKSRLDSCHLKAFGYSLCVDPLRYQGKIVEKSEINGAHDGRVLDGPLVAKSDDCVYQIVVDNCDPGDTSFVIDYRVVLLDSVARFAYAKKTAY